MRSGGSLLFLLFWGTFLLWSPLLPVSGTFEGKCGLFPSHFKGCGEPVDRFFFNVKSKKCERYVDYQCPFMRKRFITTEQCEENCAPKNVCKLPPIRGICNYCSERWFFNPKTKSCESINHKGCTGNNNFERKSVCEQLCL